MKTFFQRVLYPQLTMKFPKDILIIDFEGYTDPVQMGAVLLDKETLTEKDNFLSYIYTDLGNTTIKRSGITQEMLVGAPTQAEVGRLVYERFGTDVFVASWADTLDINHFQKIIFQVGLGWKEYDYHVLDIWPAAYIYLLKQGYTGGTGSEEMFQAFGLPPRGLHTALEDCRMAAEVLQKIVL